MEKEKAKIEQKLYCSWWVALPVPKTIGGNVDMDRGIALEMLAMRRTGLVRRREKIFVACEQAVRVPFHSSTIPQLKRLLFNLPLSFLRRQAARTVAVLPPPKEKNSHKILNKTALPYGIRDNKDARLAADALDPTEKKLIYDVLKKIMVDQYNEHKRLGQAEVHVDDLLSLGYVYFFSHFVVGVIHSVNLIFLSEYLQHFLGDRAGLTIMAGAGLANVVANVGLLNFALHFEKVLDRVNIRRPVLSAEQLHNPEVGYIQRAAKAIGMLLGSLIGLTPLFFYDHPVDTKAKKEKKIHQRSRHAPYARTFQEDTTFQYADSEEEQKRLEEEKEEEIHIHQDTAIDELEVLALSS